MKKKEIIQASQLIEHYDKLLLKLLSDDLKAVKPDPIALNEHSFRFLNPLFLIKRN